MTAKMAKTRAGHMDQRTRLANLALIAALIGGASYLAADYLPLAQAAQLAWKGSGVGFLALYAALCARDLDGWLLTAVMALGTAGDVVLNRFGLTAGGAVFFAGHLVAIGLYLRNRRAALSRQDVISAALLVPLVAVAAFRLTLNLGAAVYAAGLGAMAATAQLSRFPRSWVGVGALLFMASDLLLFARGGLLAGAAWTGPAVWSLYFAGQALICVGVVRSKK